MRSKKGGRLSQGLYFDSLALSTVLLKRLQKPLTIVNDKLANVKTPLG